MENSGIIFGNKILDVVFLAWFAAQFYKVIHSIILEKRLVISQLWETGGMPSSHTATVSALATAVGITYGLQSPIFAVSIVFAIVVMSDAAGIRRAAGKHAGMLNKLHDSLKNLLENKFHQEQLKELLGHTPVEVLVGAVLGVAIALLMYSNIFN
ncbi:MAG: divergent PAP2 family protein [Bacteroidales bacterium]|nr:divergent PAP2 family protein [Bacteroidales bacterium]